MKRFQQCMFVVFAVLFLVFPTGLAHAKRVALVVGISKYQYSPRLENPGNDAADLSAALQEVGFDVVTSLDDNLGDLLNTLDEFYARAEGAEAAAFFFAGHGIQFDGVNYLIPRDAQLRSASRLKQETVALQDVISTIENRARMTLVFLDACRDNPLADELQRSARGRDRSAAVPRGLAPMAIRNPDTLLVFAAAPGRTASDGAGRNSPFTTALMNNISEPGIEIELMMKRVTREVVQTTNGTQIPERLSRLTSDFVFNSGAAGRESVPKETPPKGVAKRTDERTSPLPSRNGCPTLPSKLLTAVDITVGSELCSRDGQHKAVVTRISDSSMGYSLGGRFEYCKVGERCAFAWPDAPWFQVEIGSRSAGAARARLMPLQ